MQLLNTGDGSVADVVGLTVFRKSSIHLTRAENDTLNLLRLIDGSSVTRVGNDPLEVRVTSELIQRGTSDRVTEKRLGEEDHES